MAKDFEGKKVKANRTTKLNTVQNQDPHPAANNFYFALRLQLGEEKEFLKKICSEKYDKDTAKCIFSKDEVTLLFTESELVQALYRANQNPEDIPQAGILLDIIEEVGE